jgi:hypothetical protein
MEFITFKNLFRKGSIITMVKIYLPGVIFLGLMVTFSLLNDFHFSFLSRDPVQILEVPPYIGIVSNVGILMWCSAAAIIFYSAKLVSQAGKPKIRKNFLIVSGLITMMLMIDDLFLFHDVVFPVYLHIGENVFFAFYGISVCAMIYFFRELILKTDYILFMLSFGFLGSSAISDSLAAMGFIGKYAMALEDSLKFMGILSWFSYYLRTSYSLYKSE